MKKILDGSLYFIGALVFAAGCLMAIYINVWVCLIGGIIGIIKVLSSGSVILLFISLMKICYSGWAGVIILSFFGFITGYISKELYRDLSNFFEKLRASF